MFSKKAAIILDIWHKLAFRLTLWYTFISIVSLISASGVFLIIAINIMHQQIDRDLVSDLHEVAATLPLVDAHSPEKAIQIEAEDGEILLRLLDDKGVKIAQSGPKNWMTLKINTDALNQIKTGEPYVLVTQTLPERTKKMRVLYGLIGPGKILQIGISMSQEKRLIKAIKSTAVPIILFFMVFSAAIGWFIANRALKGVGEVTKAAWDIAGGNFNRRVAIKSKSEEIEMLADAFNRMLDHINGLIKELKEVTDNIAHDLKTPITRMRVAAELELSKMECNDAFNELAVNTIEESDNLLQMIDTMLMISRQESGIPESLKTPVDLSSITKDAMELFSPIAMEKGIQCRSQIQDNLVIRGDVHGLQRMMVNLLENAFKYTPQGGMVTVSSYLESDNIKITVSDTGIGISEDDMPHIFKRLYRCDRSRSEAGFGLGLSLVMAVARAHRGDITVTSRLGKGSSFTVTLPR